MSFVDTFHNSESKEDIVNISDVCKYPEVLDIYIL